MEICIWQGDPVPHEPRGIHKVFGYVLIDPFVNIEGIKMNHQNQSSIITTHISLTLERSRFDYLIML